MNAFKGIPKMSTALKTLAGGFKKWIDLGVTKDVITTFRNWHLEVSRIFDPAEHKGLAMQSMFFTRFTHNIEKLAKTAQYWDKISKGMNETAKGMTKYTVAVNSLDKDKLQMVDSLMASLAAMSNVSGGLESMGGQIGDSMEEGFRLLAEEIGRLIDEQQNSGGVLADIGEAITGGGGGDTKDGEPGKSTAPAGGGIAKDIAKAVKSALSGLPGTNCK